YTIIGMQSEMDRRRIEAIGADPRKVTVFGNLKYDAAPSSRSVDRALAMFLDRWDPLWIAASTMPGEEELVLDAFKAVLKSHPNLKLLIAPRHANRFDAVAGIIQSTHLRMTRRTQLPSKGEGPLLPGEGGRRP